MLRLLWLVLFSVLLAPSALAQDPRLSIEAAFAPATAKPGDEVELVVTADIEEGYHVYGRKDDQPVKLKVLEARGLEAIGELELPDGTAHTAYGMTNYWVLGQIVLKQRFKVPLDAKDGPLKIAAQLQYLACTESFCDPPAKDPVSATLTITGGAASTPTKPQVQEQTAGRLRATARFVPATARPGDEVVLEVACEIDAGYHVYGKKDDNPTKFAVLDAAGLQTAGDFEFPSGDAHTAFGFTNYWVTGKPVLQQRFVVPKDAASGEHAIEAAIDYLPCTESFCEKAGKATVRAVLTVEGGAPAPAANGNPGDAGKHGGAGAPGAVASGDGAPAKPTDPEVPVKLRQPKFALDDGSGVDGSLWSLILLCIGGGLLALAMPCTYPMIPITFSFFTKQADARQGSVLPLALAYGIGIVGIFVLIGVAVGEVIVQFAAHWITNAVIGTAFVVFAASLFGWIVLQPPQFVNRIAGNAGRTGGLIGVFLMGATLVISSFTCTAPIVGSLLASVATAGRARVALGMAVFGLTMALPFVLLALLPGRVKKLPKSGEWMNTLKVSLGFVELAAALKFLSNVDIVLGWGALPRELFLGAWAFLFALLALYLFGLFAPRSEPATGVSTARNSAGIAALAFATFCFAGVSGLSLGFVMTAFEPNYQLRAVQEHEIVVDDHLAALELARREHKFVLVNFTGFT